MSTRYHQTVWRSVFTALIFVVVVLLAPTATLSTTSAQGQVKLGGTVACDFDGDRRTDLAVWRGPQGLWYINHSFDNEMQTSVWGLKEAPYNDIPTPGDYDGDGKADVAVFRPFDGNWYILRSSDGGFFVQAFGLAGDIPVPGDYDGDGKTDLAIWRGQESLWYVMRSSDNLTYATTWGAQAAPYYDVPVPGDYDGDGKTDIAVFRRGDGTWYIQRSTDGGATIEAWGTATDMPVQGDYDGDGKCNIAVWRGEEGNWYILNSSPATRRTKAGYQIITWGTQSAPYNDVPVPGDYDGDGKTDVAVWRTSTCEWFALRSSDNSYLIKVHGEMGDIALPVMPQ